MPSDLLRLFHILLRVSLSFALTASTNAESSENSFAIISVSEHFADISKSRTLDAIRAESIRFLVCALEKTIHSKTTTVTMARTSMKITASIVDLPILDILDIFDIEYAADIVYVPF